MGKRKNGRQGFNSHLIILMKPMKADGHSKGKSSRHAPQNVAKLTKPAKLAQSQDGQTIL